MKSVRTVRKNETAGYEEFMGFLGVGTVEGFGFLDFGGQWTELSDAVAQVVECVS